MALLGPKQAKFVSTLARQTGLNPRVLTAWAVAEQSGSAARGYEQRNYSNFLNIARTDSGDAGGAHAGVWSDPVTAAHATAQWLQGRGPIARSYGKPAAGIRQILSTAGKGPSAQINAIATSGWASSGYNGGSTLRSLFQEASGQKLPPPGGGGEQRPGSISVQQQQGEVSPEQLQQAVSEIKALIEPQQGSPVQRAMPALPSFAARPPLPQGAPSTPAGIEPQKQGPSVEQLAQRVLSSLSPEPTSKVVSTPASATAPAQGAAGAKNLTAPKGTVDFEGKKVAAWIAPALQYARSKGWKGTVNSGYRSFAEQKRIYDSGVRPAAVPGTSNHEGDAFPRGAVDVSGAQELAKILQGSPYRKLLVYAGAKDPVHFSHPHGGSY